MGKILPDESFRAGIAGGRVQNVHAGVEKLVKHAGGPLTLGCQIGRRHPPNPSGETCNPVLPNVVICIFETPSR